MSDRAWLTDETRKRVRDAIVDIELCTGAEVVATVSARSGHYRHADYLFGAISSLAALGFYFLYPEPLFDDVAVVIVIVAFFAGAFFSAAVQGLRRLLVSRPLMNQNVATTARSRFVEQGISATSGRTGILVYVSLFEDRAEVVPDIGIPVGRLGERWTKAVEAIDAGAREGVGPFLTALTALGPILAEAVPRSADDKNELPDEVVSA